jgi:hypothetical protein
MKRADVYAVRTACACNLYVDEGFLYCMTLPPRSTQVTQVELQADTQVAKLLRNYKQAACRPAGDATDLIH